MPDLTLEIIEGEIARVRAAHDPDWLARMLNPTPTDIAARADLSPLLASLFGYRPPSERALKRRRRKAMQRRRGSARPQ